MDRHTAKKVKCKSDRTTGMEMQSLQDWQNLVISSLQYLCGELDAAKLQECLTDGALDDEKVCRMVCEEGPFGTCVQREGATIDEIIISLIRYHRQDFKKDARCWRHKSSFKQHRRRSIPSLQELMNISTTTIMQEGRRQERMDQGYLNDNPPMDATPPCSGDFPPTPTISCEHLQCMGDNEQPPSLPSDHAQYPPSWMPSTNGFSNLVTIPQDGYRSDGSDGHSDDGEVVNSLGLHRRESGRLISPNREVAAMTEDNLIGMYERLRYSRHAQRLPRVEELPSEVGLRRTVSERLLGSNRSQHTTGVQQLGYTVTTPPCEEDVSGLENLLPRVPHRTPGGQYTDENLRSLNSNRNSSNRSYNDDASPLGSSTRYYHDAALLGGRTPLGLLNMTRATSSDEEEDDQDLYR